MNREQVEAAARDLVAADCGCPPILFDSAGVAVILSRPGEGRPQQPSRALHLMCFGSGVLIACSETHFEWAERNLAELSRDEIFSPPTLERINAHIEQEQPGWELNRPTMRFLCAAEALTTEIKIAGMEVKLGPPSQFAELYRLGDDLPNALSRQGVERDKMIAAVYRQGRLVSAAGASADANNVWDIGVDTLPAERHKGAAKFAVWQLTRALLKDRIAPVYSTLLSNLTSQRVAHSVGYWPAWLEVYARPASNNSQAS